MASSHSFLAGGGEMGARMRSLDWSKTSLGAVERWPQSLLSPLSMLLPSKAQIILFWGPEFVVFYNDAYRTVFGAKHPKMLGMPGRVAWSEIWDAGANLHGLLDGVVRKGEAFSAQDKAFVLERNGFTEETYFDVSYDPVRDESGAVGGVFCIVTETTGRVVGERRMALLNDLAARNATARTAREACRLAMQTLANARDVAFALAYLEGKLQACTPRAEEQLAQAQPDIVKELSIVSPAPGGPAGKLLIGINPQRPFDDQYRSFLDLVASQLTTAVTNAHAYEEERKRAEALAEIDRAKTAFFSNVSHEFRTPLTLMLGPVQDSLADVEAPLPPAQRERLELAHRSALRLQKLVNTLLDFSRIEAGRADARYAPTDLPALTTELASSFRSAIEKAGLKLVVECAPLAEAAYVDRDMWEKIVLNLLSNAFKFTFEGEIAVVLRRDGAALELSVRDTGTGIPAGELPYLFERFHRVTGARGRTHEGTGIGLAFVRELAKLHGGTVRVDSVEGRGSTFTVSIPAGKAHLPADRIGSERTLASTSLSAEAFTEEALRWLPGAADAAPKRAVSGQRILIADDNADLREYLQRLLGSQYQVEAVADGEAALALARQRRPDLVLTDVMMPRLDGFGLIRELRSDPDLHAVPVIVLSARAGEESRLEGLEKGADDYLLKPFSAGELLGRVGAFLRSAEARREALEQERLAAEQTRRNEQELSDFFDNATVAMHWVGPDGTILRVNKAELNLLGYNREEYVGRHIAEFHVDRPAIDDILARLTRGENVHERPVRLRCKDGSIREVVINSSGLFENGRFIHSRCFTQDLTERNLTTQALARLAAIVESSDDAIIGKNLDGIITSWNRSAERLFGYTAQEAIGRPVTMLMPPEQVNEEPGILERIRRGDRMDHYETVRRRKDGMLLDISLSVSPILAGDGKVIGASKIARDITERKRTEAALRDDERRKEEFLAMVSHELRNPLAPIRNAVTLLQQVDDDAEIRRQAIAILDRQIEHMTRLVEELLDLSRIGGGAIEVRKQEVDLAAIVQTALEISRPLVEAGRHQLDVTLPGTPVSIVADRVRMAQVVSNLLNNAAKYTPRGGRIGLNVSTAPDAAAISVRDNGIGIAAGDLPKLFRMFTQLEGARLRSPGGMGVGLALARQLVELHGGTIEARSEGPGRGSEFTVRIPLTAADRPGTSTQTI